MPVGLYAAVARKTASALAALAMASCYALVAMAQAPNATPGQTPGLQGTGPRVDVQSSANGTLDVGGTGGADLNMTGENFRGSFGASRSQPGWSVAPGLPRSTFQVPFAAPNFNLSLPSPSAPRDSLSQTNEADLAAYPGLILPRFRGALAGSTSAADEHSSVERQRGEMVSPGKRADAWRFRYSGGRWWYWQPGESWLYWNGAQWQAFAPRP
ncbi:MAG TPA: hypothetical protein VHY91_17575 [Pirellulales bacterium]|jgi:hypothetical protein|nr:hypothetical protein [Pirellulales bacterium]